MVKIKLGIPIDSTFLSSIIYDGILYSIAHSNKLINFNTYEIEFEEEFMKELFKELKDYENIKIRLTGRNDGSIKKLNQKINQKGTFGEIIKKLCEDDKSLITKKEINLFLKPKGENLLIDLEKNRERGITLQLLKVDRYTGLTSIEAYYTLKQLTSYFSKEAILISLLGIYSSYIHSLFIPSTSRKVQPFHYFLFFSPSETLELFFKNDPEYVRKLFRIKEKAKNILRKVIEYSPINEILFLELIFNIELHKLMENENLDKVSLTIIKLAQERQTYKIYEEIPITIFKTMLFNEKVKEYFKNYDRFLESLSQFLLNENVHRALRSFHKQQKMDEAEKILSAIQNLYKFIILGDLQGYSNFMRELWEAHEIVKDKTDIYAKLIKAFPT
ncbi:MAG: hypothetical protein QW272_09160 [Candidatus Methanomethylicaceae archaeon]